MEPSAGLVNVRRGDRAGMVRDVWATAGSRISLAIRSRATAIAATDQIALVLDNS